MDHLGRNLHAEIINLVHSDVPFTDLMIQEDLPFYGYTPSGWMPFEGKPIERDDIENFFEMLDPDWKFTLEQGNSINRTVDLVSWRVRINAYNTAGSKKLSLAIRRISATPLTLKEIGLHTTLPIMAQGGKGLIIVNGSTSSGKSTTLAAQMDYYNKNEAKHIITIEDPIEYLFKHDKSLFSQREVPSDVSSFDKGVKDALRQKPNIIVIGEIRDRPTAEQALLAAESGVLVMCTLHANTPAGAIQKMLSFFPADERESKRLSLASSLLGIVSQILLKRQDQSGWVLAAELLFNHERQVSAMIGNSDQITKHIEDKRDPMNITMVDSLIKLVRSKVVSKRDAIMSVDGLTQSTLSHALEND